VQVKKVYSRDMETIPLTDPLAQDALKHQSAYYVYKKLK